MGILRKLINKKAARSRWNQNEPTVVHIGAGRNADRDDLIKRYAQAQQLEYFPIPSQFDFGAYVDVIKNAALVALWNGWHDNGPLVARLCRIREIPLFYFERGLLPQSNSYLTDPSGFCGDSILNHDLSWINEDNRSYLQQKREEMQKEFPVQDKGYILVPLQMENDSQILYHTPFRSMNEFVLHVETIYEGRKIIIRPHPKDPTDYTSETSEVIREGDFLKWACEASEVVGLTSTCLYEAGVLGVPVTALGNHPLKSQPRAHHEDVLAGILALAVPRKNGDIEPILRKFGIKPRLKTS